MQVLSLNWISMCKLLGVIALLFSMLLGIHCNRRESQLPVMDETRDVWMNISDSPWNIAIETFGRFDQKHFICGGVLIHPRVVLTSASCFDDHESRLPIRIRDNKDLVHEVRRIIKNEKYLVGSFYNDVALLILNQPVDTKLTLNVLGDDRIIYRVPIPVSALNNPPEKILMHASLTTKWEHTNVFASYLNETKSPLYKEFEGRENEYTRMPVYTHSKTISDEACEKRYVDYCRRKKIDFKQYFPDGIINTTLLCAYMDQGGTCNKNRGFQLVATSSETIDSENNAAKSLGGDLMLIGTRAQVNKFSVDESICKKDKYRLPTIYTNLTELLPWIMRTLRRLDFR